MKVTDEFIVKQEELLLEKLASNPDQEYVVSMHATYSAAKTRASQMRRSSKWSKLPVSLRAVRTPADMEDVDGFEGLVLAQYTGVVPDGTARGRMVACLDLKAMPADEVDELIGRVVAAYEIQADELEIPIGYLRIRHEKGK